MILQSSLIFQHRTKTLLRCDGGCAWLIPSFEQNQPSTGLLASAATTLIMAAGTGPLFMRKDTFLWRRCNHAFISMVFKPLLPSFFPWLPPHLKSWKLIIPIPWVLSSLTQVSRPPPFVFFTSNLMIGAFLLDWNSTSGNPQEPGSIGLWGITLISSQINLGCFPWSSHIFPLPSSQRAAGAASACSQKQLLCTHVLSTFPF